MADKFKIEDISDAHKDLLVEQLEVLIKNVQDNDEFDLKREAVDRVILQDTYHDYYNLPATSTNHSVNNERLAESSEEEADEFSSLHDPILYRLSRSWVNNIKNACFPINGEWTDIKRKHCKFLKDLGLKEFIPDANQAWVNIIKTENEKFLFKKKYSASISELVNYGNTGVVHYYDPDEHYVNIATPGLSRLSVYPITDRWREANLVYEYDRNYSELTGRTDLNQDIIRAIKPQTSLIDLSNRDDQRGSTRQKEVEQRTPPYGKVRLYDIFVPSLYLEDLEDESDPIIGEGLYLTVLHNPQFKNGRRAQEFGYSRNTLILKASKNVSRLEHGILLAAAGTTMPGVFYHQGFIAPFLSHQMLLNQLISSVSRVVALLADPALSLLRQDGYDFDEVDRPQELIPGAEYEGWDVKAIIPPEYFQVLNQYSALQGLVGDKVETGSGMSKQQLAGTESGRRSASEVREAISSGQLNVFDATDQYDSEILQQSLINRIGLTQKILRDQIESEVEAQSSPDEDNDYLYEEALEDNELFLRLLEFSGIEDLYEEFYQKRTKELMDNDDIINQIEQLVKQITSLQELAQSEIPPPVASPVTIDPQTGIETPTQLEQDQAEEAYYQQEEARRQEAINQIQALQDQIESAKLKIKDIKEIPEPSYKIYYEILSHPIRDSDVQVTGSKTSMAKDFARQNMKEFTAYLEAVPGAMSDYDMADMTKQYARDLGLNITFIKKDEAEKRREEEELARKAQLNEQFAQQAANAGQARAVSI